MTQREHGELQTAVRSLREAAGLLATNHPAGHRATFELAVSFIDAGQCAPPPTIFAGH